MKKIILASHGKLSEGMYDSVRMIIGNVDGLLYFGLKEGQDNNELADQIEDYMNETGNESTYIIVCDLLGGSVSNAVSRFSVRDNVYVINGMNMGLVISLILDTQDVSEYRLQELIEESKTGINLVSLSGTSTEEEII
ncbi:MAG: PTS sugar transporter subunit IIA [Erysipelotrichaceae bacterium]|nr:PTS sugar transporter subunit IIA [Erysipelotrichaceae bacterium]